MRVGFSGSRYGMDERQYERFAAFALALRPRVTEFHHGDCVESDASAHRLFQEYKIPIHIHPPEKPEFRAYCQGAIVVEQERPYLMRNRIIVDSTDVLLATPAHTRGTGGTWYTIKYALKQRKNVYIFLPNGATEFHTKEW